MLTSLLLQLCKHQSAPWHSWLTSSNAYPIYCCHFNSFSSQFSFCSCYKFRSKHHYYNSSFNSISPHKERSRFFLAKNKKSQSTLIDLILLLHLHIHTLTHELLSSSISSGRFRKKAKLYIHTPFPSNLFPTLPYVIPRYTMMIADSFQALKNSESELGS